METLITLTAILDILAWVGLIVLGGLTTSLLTFVFSKPKHSKLREHAKWWGVGFGVLIVLLIIAVGFIDEQISAIGDSIETATEEIESRTE